jgi:hypothetical protein
MANEPETPPTETPSPPPVGAPAREPATPPAAPSTVINFNNPLANARPDDNGTGPSAEHPGRSVPKAGPAKVAGKAGEAVEGAAEEAGEWVERTVLEVPPWVTVGFLLAGVTIVVAIVVYQRNKDMQRQATAAAEQPPEQPGDNGQGVVRLEKPSFMQ